MYFYLWQHRYVDDFTDRIIARTCFGITGNTDNRRNGYEGHVGHPIQFVRVWAGPERLIRDLEDRVKSDFQDYLVVGHRNFRYEWINEEISLDSVIKYVEWEISRMAGITQVNGSG